MNKSSNPNNQNSSGAQGPKKNNRVRRRPGSKPKSANQQRSRDKDSKSVSAPAARSKVNRTGRPKIIRSSLNGDIVVKHREFIRDVSGTDLFTALTIPINPGLIQSFPWLSTIANSYESYIFEQLDYKYEPSCSTTTEGTVILAVEYDTSDAAPASKQQVMAYRNSVRSPCWSGSDHCSEQEDLHKRKTYYTRRGNLGANLGAQTFDTGDFYLCTAGMSNDNMIGELYVDYTVRLMTPQLSDVAIGGALGGSATGTSANNKFSMYIGKIPLTIANPNATQTQITFGIAWEGYISFVTDGTGMLLGSARITLVFNMGGSSFQVDEVATAATSKGINIFSIRVSAGEIMFINFTNTSASQADFYMGQADATLV